MCEKESTVIFRTQCRLTKREETPISATIAAGFQAALNQAEGQPVTKIAEATFNVTGDRRKMLVEAVSAFVDTPAVYQNAPTFAQAIGEYAVSKTGMLTGPANEALMAALNAKGFIVE